MLDESVAALNENRFLDEPDPGQEGGVAENPWSWALDLTNEFAKQLQEPAYLDVGARLLQRLLDHYYLPDVGALVEYATPEGLPLADDQGRYVVDPGHSIEFASFALEFSRLAELAGAHEALRADANRLCPPLILWNLARGWNPAHPGIFKSFDLNTGQPINRTMPWWSLPETMLALLLAFERTRDVQLLSKYKDVNNAYFGRYLNPKTGYGPYQTLDGDTGQPLDLPPACKFQDPEFHSGKNILTCIQVLERTGRQQ
jgi:mannose/cellobiose epimerase-like protein (N-acyl-D-glucosamine 2-epimerase family)